MDKNCQTIIVAYTGAALLMMLGFVNTAIAFTITTYVDRPTFDANTGGTSIVDFEAGFGLVDTYGLADDEYFQIFVDDLRKIGPGGFAPGFPINGYGSSFLAPGVSLTSETAGQDVNIGIIGKDTSQASGNLTSRGYLNFFGPTFPSAAVINFDAGQTAFGLDLGPSTSDYSVDFYDGATLLGSEVFSTTTALAFYGYTFDQPVTTVRLTTTAGGNVLYDNLTFGNSAVVVPIPASAWLFGSGLVGLAGLKRRRG